MPSSAHQDEEIVFNGEDDNHNSTSNGRLLQHTNLQEITQPPQKYKLRCAVKENHHNPIYCAAFSRHVHEHYGGEETGGNSHHLAVFATCGGNYSTIYEISESGNIDGESPLTVRQVYRDSDPDEVFYTCAFGGRGVVGSHVGFSTDGGGAENGESVRHNSISFGQELHTEKQPHNSINGVKRLRIGDNAQPYRCKKIENHGRSSFHLPYSTSQNGPPLLCLAGTRGVIKVIDTNLRALYMTLSGHGNDITDLKFSPTNEWLLLSSSKDESVRLWNLQRGVNVAVFTGHHGHRGQVLSVAWHMSGSKIATCAMDNTVKLWRIFSEGGSKCGPIETAVRKSFTVVPDDWGGKNEACRKLKPIFHQFPYFSTDKAHTNYVGRSNCELFLAHLLWISLLYLSFSCRYVLKPCFILSIDCVQFVGDLILSKSVSNKVVLWKPLFNNDIESEQTIHVKHRVPSSILFLREFTLDHCGSWYVRFESPPPYHQILALGNQKGEVKIWRIGNGDDDSGCHPNQKYFCNLKTSEYFNGAYDQSTVRLVTFNPHGFHLVAVKDDSTVWVWDPEF